MARKETRTSFSDILTVQYPLHVDNSRVSTTYSLYEFIENDFKEEEERDMVVYRVRESILKRILDRFEEKNEEERVQARTLECFGIALKTLVDWYYLPRDPEDVPLDWDRDFEVEPVQPDTWASFTAPYQDYPPDKRFEFHRGPRLERSWVEDGEEDEGNEDVEEVDEEEEDAWEGSGEKKRGLDQSKDSIMGHSGDLSFAQFFDETSKTATDATHKTRSSSKKSKSKSKFSHRKPTVKREVGLFIHPKDFPTIRAT